MSQHPNVVEVHISAVALSWLKPAPVSLVDGGPVETHTVLWIRGRWGSRRVVASVDARTAQLVADSARQLLRSAVFVFFGLLSFALLAIIGSAIAGTGNFGGAAACWVAGIVVGAVVCILGMRVKLRVEQTVPIGIRHDRDGGVVVSPVHPAAAQAWAEANPPGSMRIVDLPAAAAGPIEQR